MAQKLGKLQPSKVGLVSTIATAAVALGITFTPTEAEGYGTGDINNLGIHPLLAEKLVEFCPSSLYNSLEMKKGTIDEDSSLSCLYCRAWNHFQHWKYQDGLNIGVPFPDYLVPLSVLEKAPCGIIYPLDPPPLSVKQWAQCGIVQSYFPFGDHSWEKVIEEYKAGIIGKSFGSNFHLVSDLTVPAHTRNDIHNYMICNSEELEDGTKEQWCGDSYEDWASEHKEKINDIAPQEKNIPKFDTLNELFDSLSYFTGSNFYSDDTVDGEIDCTWEKDEKGKNFCYREVEGKKVKILRKGLFTDFPNADCFEDYWPILGTKAVEYGAAAVKLLEKEAQPVCVDACDYIDQKTCSGNGFKTCNDYNNDGCLEWNYSSCGWDEYCVSGECQTEISECTVEGTLCIGNTIYQEDSCDVLTKVKDCTNSQYCEKAKCIDNAPICVDKCDYVGKKTCSGSDVAECVKKDGCLKWIYNSCGGGEICKNGDCIITPETGKKCVSSTEYKENGIVKSCTKDYICIDDGNCVNDHCKPCQCFGNCSNEYTCYNGSSKGEGFWHQYCDGDLKCPSNSTCVNEYICIVNDYKCIGNEIWNYEECGGIFKIMECSTGSYCFEGSAGAKCKLKL